MKIFGVAAFLFLAVPCWASSTDVEFPSLKFGGHEPGSLFRPPMLQNPKPLDRGASEKRESTTRESSRFDVKTGILAPPTGIDYTLIVKPGDFKVDPAMVIDPTEGKASNKR